MLSQATFFGPIDSAAMSSVQDRTTGALAPQENKWKLPIVFLLIGIIGYLDYLTTWELNLALLYAVPILMVALGGNLRLAVVVAVACGLVWIAANFSSHPYRSNAGYAWASISRMVHFLLVAIGGVAYYKQRQEMRARLEASQRARALEHEIVRVSEREQMQLGQELHDGLCQNLAAIDCAAACLQADLEEKSMAEADAARMIQKMLRESVIDARNLARGISPVHTDADDLTAVLEDLATTMTQKGQIIVRFLQHGKVPRLEPQTSLHLLRIAQESVRNAIKHAEAETAVIELGTEDNCLQLSVIDDGKGFSGTASGSKGMGVGTMRYRARLIGAELQIAKMAEKGTRLSCTLPLYAGSERTP